MFRKIIQAFIITCILVLLIFSGISVQKKFTQNPTVSVIITSYNMADTLPKAIDSIIAQTLSNWELIIINDGSTDDTDQVLKAYSDKDPRIRVVNNRSNLGIPISLNEGLDRARGQYIARLDADDTAYPDRLSRQVQFMENNQLDLASAQFDTPTARFIKGTPMVEDDTNTAHLGFQLLFNNIMAHPTVMMRKSFLDQHHLKYNPKRPNAEDYDLWLQIFLNGGKLAIMGGHPVTTYHYSGHSDKWWRISDNSLSLSQMDAFRRILTDIPPGILEKPMCDLLPYLIEGSKKNSILSTQDLEKFELAQCLPTWEFIHPNWTDRLYVIKDNLCSRAKVHDEAIVTRNGDDITVKWKKWSEEHYICKQNKCIKAGYNPPEDNKEQ